MAVDDKPSEPGDATTLDEGTSTGFRVSPTLPVAPREGRYKRGRELARGGLGTVTAAHDVTLRREVAVKELHEQTEVGRQRFVRETFTTARLQHPAIVPVFDAGTWDSGDPFLVLKLLDGKTLSDEVATRATTAERLALVPNLLTVADALGYAHEQGVVHRDVKPSNIMIGTHGETVLLDWGVAHDSAAEATPEGTVGTLRYMSPEQARGEPTKPAFDVYSLGATMAFVLGGDVPFEGVANAEMLARLRGGELPRQPLPAEVPADLASIVAKAMAPERDRYGHAGELADDLRKFIAGQLVGARTYTARQLFARWVRRNRLAVAVIVAALVAVAVIAIVAVRSVVGERDVAMDERARAEQRARDIVLLEARSHLQTDPTETIAWLKDYPEDAPELVAMVDEAAGRGVARHVWPAAVDATFADGALLVAERTGGLVRADLATGARRPLATLARRPLFVRSRGDAVFVLDEDGALWQWTAAGLVRRAAMSVRSRPTGMYVTAKGIKVTFAGAPTAWISDTMPRYPAFAASDDQSEATAMYGVSPDGALAIADPEPRRLWQFPPGTTVRSSNDATSYVAIARSGMPDRAAPPHGAAESIARPGMLDRSAPPHGGAESIDPGDQTSTIWLGHPDGTAPVALGSLPACTTGDIVALSDDGHLVTVLRCGTLTIFDGATRRTATDVAAFMLSPRGRWVAIGRRDGIDMLEVASGAIHRLGFGAATVVGFARDDSAMFSSGTEQGLRVWDLPAGAAAPIGFTAAVIGLTDRDDTLAIRGPLSCAVWSGKRITASAELAASAARTPDEWPWDRSDDGRSCVLAGRDGAAVVIRAGEAPQVLRDSSAIEECLLGGDGKLASCREADGSLVTFAAGARVTSRKVTGTIHGLVRYHGRALALVKRATGCALEAFDGTELASLPAGCRHVRASGVRSPMHETGVVVRRTDGVDVWTELATLPVAGESKAIEVSSGGLVAVAREQAVEIWDLRSRARRPQPPDHARAIEVMAWSNLGLLASADDQVIQLWDPASDRTRAIVAPHVTSLVWSTDGRTLYASDGATIDAWPSDLAPARLETLTSARIVNGRVLTP